MTNRPASRPLAGLYNYPQLRNDLRRSICAFHGIDVPVKRELWQRREVPGVDVMRTCASKHMSFARVKEFIDEPNPSICDLQTIDSWMVFLCADAAGHSYRTMLMVWWLNVLIKAWGVSVLSRLVVDLLLQYDGMKWLRNGRCGSSQDVVVARLQEECHAGEDSFVWSKLVTSVLEATDVFFKGGRVVPPACSLHTNAGHCVGHATEVECIPSSVPTTPGVDGEDAPCPPTREELRAAEYEAWVTARLSSLYPCLCGGKKSSLVDRSKRRTCPLHAQYWPENSRAKRGVYCV